MIVAAEIDAIFEPYRGTRSPGCAVAVVRAGAVEFARGYGMADLERSVVISPRSVFDIGSTSKQFTAACVVLLAQDEKLSLDDQVRRWIPELPDYGVSLTIRHLIHHTSGLRDYLTLLVFGGRPIENQYSREEITNLIARQQALDFPSGSRFAYSNSGYYLLGEIVRAASGTSLRQFAHERIFEPLGMAHTFFRDDLFEIIPNRALAYSPDEDGGYRIDMSIMDIVGDGAVHTTVGDLALWDRVFYEPDILPGGAELIPAMLVPGRLNDDTELEYASGLMHGTHSESRIVSHGGSWGGYRAEMVRFPEQRLTVIVLCNLASMDASGLALQVADAVLGDKQEGAAQEDGASADAVDLELWLGIYADEESRIVLELVHGDAGPEARFAGQQFPLDAAGPARVRVRGTGLEIECGEDGALLLVLSTGPAIKLRPVTDPIPTSLDAFTGRYHSPELDTGYEIVLEDGALRYRAGYAEWEELRPVGGTVFRARYGNLLFEHGERVAHGFTLNSLRAAGIRFSRLS